MHQSPSGWWGLPYKQGEVGFNSHLVHMSKRDKNWNPDWNFLRASIVIWLSVIISLTAATIFTAMRA